MRLEDFDYDLPEELIAQEPAPDRDRSRLLKLSRASGEIRHALFPSLLDELRSGDLLVLNDTRVIPARLFGRKAGTGGSVEVLLLRRNEGNVWEALVSPGRRVQVGHTIEFADGVIASVRGRTETGGRLLSFALTCSCESPAPEESFLAWLKEQGTMPLPPYIRRDLEDPERYQTVYSRAPGAVAAPTAGLHFTLNLLGRLAALGVETAFVTLHVGLGTFRPVKTQDITQHVMKEEFYTLSLETARALERCRREGRRVIAVGTTSVRVLESVFDGEGRAAEIEGRARIEGRTSLFIYPGYRFKMVDALVTNFHLPRSTLLMLVSAFAGRENILKAYREAVEQRYRFYSLGDAMFIS
jgi:S-adenosylmethionine:tRNA ribosyltransferase-isomerase